MDYNGAITQLQMGHLTLAVCALLYLAWWTIYFLPDLNPSAPLKAIGVICILGAIGTGGFAIYKIAMGLAQLPSVANGWVLAAAGLAAYVIALLVTFKGLGRPVTTELALIVAWTTLEVAVICALAATGTYSAAFLVTFSLVIVLAAAASLVCYNAFYHLEALPGFIDGCGPLVAVGIVSLVFALLL